MAIARVADRIALYCRIGDVLIILLRTKLFPLLKDYISIYYIYLVSGIHIAGW